LGAHRPLPEFFWTGATDMRCLSDCIRTTREDAHAHHIQRLMVLGNFCLIAGIDPQQVADWYLAVYADAYEWVELPNVHGMVLFADGGLLASKPYVASGAYIDRMSDYCAGCRYDVKAKAGPTACPFNYLYWDFLERHRAVLDTNHRLGMIYRSFDRMSPARKAEIAADAADFLARMERDETV
jgi:deoxyribodipyrimidine photolyase-related protein